MTTATNPGQLIYQISQEAAVTPYPAFTAGYQPTAYQTINGTLQKELNSSQYTDLRAAYLDPITFPPGTLLTDVTAIPQPSGLNPSQQADWQTVQSQLETELTEISSLYNFWTQIQINANSVSTEFDNRFQTAMNTLNSGSPDGTLGWLGIFLVILSLNPETSIYQSIIPSVMAVVYYDNADWGPCAYNGYGLGYTPIQSGQEGYNGDLCNRFAQIGVNLSDVVDQQNGWTGIPTWSCVSTREGTYCSQYNQGSRKDRGASALRH